MATNSGESSVSMPVVFDALTDDDVREIVARLRAKCDFAVATECWNITDFGKYKHLMYKGRRHMSRVYAWAALHRRELPPNHRIKPTCRNMACVNPEHMTCVAKISTNREYTPIEAYSDADFRKIATRVRAKSKVDQQTSCWMWIRTETTVHPLLTFKGHVWSARTLAWSTVSHRSPRSEHRIVTTCRNRFCVNPAHMSEEPVVSLDRVTGLTAKQRQRKRLRENSVEREQHLQKQRKRWRGDPVRRLNSLKEGATKRRLEFALSDEEVLAMFGQPCHYCGLASSPDYLTGVDRKDNALGYTVDNCVPCCATCNRAKMCLTDGDFVRACCHVASYFELSDDDARRCHFYPHVFTRAGAKLKAQLHAYRHQGTKTGDATFTDALILRLLQEPCTYCGIERANGIDRIDSKRGYVANNVTSCCYTCNRMKLHYDVAFFLDKCESVARRLGPMLVAEALVTRESSTAPLLVAEGAIVEEEDMWV